MKEPIKLEQPANILKTSHPLNWICRKCQTENYPGDPLCRKCGAVRAENSAHGYTERSMLFEQLCQYVGNTKYGEGYEFNFQMWNAFWTIYINKDNVELTSVSGETASEALEQALKYLTRIKAKKAK